ncbi:3374_t:CDS:1 [Funneliformis mosseae]|uniref:3374_t:CDS:1 n=1 Tax=Funneliformis mosseae TaxID=27381 RepID=A0A9N8ZMU7_FUNMO|nr:3374_t:CDS:1 [Funneliformis mosseae]
MKKTEFLKNGYLVRDDFLSKEQCSQLLNHIKNFQNSEELPIIYRENSDRPLHYKVINGLQIKNSLQEIENLYRDRINKFICDISNLSLVPLNNEIIGANVNITPSGGTYRWHYDRNSVTALIYLNEVDGGELELYPLYRITSPFNKFSFLQKALDLLLMSKPIRFVFGKKVSIKPIEGRLVVMIGNRCLHSVNSVIGSEERVNVVLSYDVLDNQDASNDNLDNYLYTQIKVTSSDPNYQKEIRK